MTRIKCVCSVAYGNKKRCNKLQIDYSGLSYSSVLTERGVFTMFCGIASMVKSCEQNTIAYTCSLSARTGHKTVFLALTNDIRCIDSFIIKSTKAKTKTS